jgi:hypothetical protein
MRSGRFRKRTKCRTPSDPVRFTNSLSVILKQKNDTQKDNLMGYMTPLQAKGSPYKAS